MAVETKALPSAEQETKELPTPQQKRKRLPSTEIKKKALPAIGDPVNSIKVGDQIIEIKPTKVKYQRNKTAQFYKVLEIYPLQDILQMEAGTFGDERDGDKAVMDWLIAVFDDEQLVLEKYDEFDTGMIEKLITIYKRVNEIDDKEEKLKNLARARTDKA